MEALINMVCELKIRSGCKKKCKNFMVIRHSIKELLAKSLVTLQMKCIVVKNNQLYHYASPPTESDICALDVYPTMHLLIQREKVSLCLVFARCVG